MPIRWRLPLVLALSTLVFAGIVALASSLLLREVFLDRLQDDMSRQAHQFAAIVTDPELEVGDPATLQLLTQRAGGAGQVRLTLIQRDGTVLADSDTDPATLDNHATRPEVAQALGGNEGRARRESATLGQQEIYVAVPLVAGTTPWSEGVLRAALPASRIDEMLASSWRIPLITWAILLLPTLVVAYFLTRSITAPLEKLRHMTARVASGDLAYRTSVHSDDELGDLAGSLNSMAVQLQTRDGELRVEMERSTKILEAMSEGVLLIDADGRLLRCNSAAESILGAKLQGMEGSPFVFAARAFPARLLAHKAQQAGQVVREVIELPENRFLAVEVIPLSVPEASGAHTLFVMRDETARRAVDKMRRDFATNVSHELKTPLAGISLLAETLGHAIREDPGEAERFVERLAAEIERLKGLTTDLLTLSRLEEPDYETRIEFALTDLTRLASEAAGEVASAAATKHQELTTDLPAAAPVVGDDVALRTMIRNLLDNAIRYTDPGGHIRLSVRTEESGPGGEPTPGPAGEAIPVSGTAPVGLDVPGPVPGPGPSWIVLSVSDDGEGIPQSEQQRIFERFYRVDKARSRDTGGTGLGLSIVRHVAERHGGRVEVESTLGVGSRFTVWIPADGGRTD